MIEMWRNAARSDRHGPIRRHKHVVLFKSRAPCPQAFLAEEDPQNNILTVSAFLGNAAQVRRLYGHSPAALAYADVSSLAGVGGL